METPRKIAIATSTRADWGLLSPIARALDARNDCQVTVIATNMHLDPRYGMTVDEIEADGFLSVRRVEMNAESDSPQHTAVASARCMAGFADVFAELSPDIVVILGDRYEMLSVAAAATIMRIPIVHIAGGEISEGAFDDSIRHAITKLSSLHLTATEPYRQRVISMGEDPAKVINTGAIGVWNMTNEQPITKPALEQSIGMEITPGTLLVTLHPATLDSCPTATRIDALLQALDRFPLSRIIFTYPNNDPDGSVIISRINAYAAENAARCAVVPSLGHKRYLSALHYVAAVVGNSSSGIVEVPSAGIPTVDIGIRQQGRLASQSVIHCEADSRSIAAAIETALSPSFREMAATAPNPYCRPDTLSLIVNAIATVPLSELAAKRFIDHNLNTTAT
ncbi:MAG: UDP-N-acetylglucosamine 2-epimerase (hydrolyzing) [Muribaculaceae bacterium]|nr:UDP-N-acetylglucosamine 2-epimerase (hydrolyzing) [Muribaculaceae bacterium]